MRKVIHVLLPFTFIDWFSIFQNVHSVHTVNFDVTFLSISLAPALEPKSLRVVQRRDIPSYTQKTIYSPYQCQHIYWFVNHKNTFSLITRWLSAEKQYKYKNPRKSTDLKLSCLFTHFIYLFILLQNSLIYRRSFAVHASLTECTKQKHLFVYFGNEWNRTHPKRKE